MSIEGQGHFFTIYFPGFVCFLLTRPRCQVSVYRTIGPLISDCDRYREIKDIEDTLNLQEDIEHLGSWAENWVRDFKQSNVT